MSGKQWEYLDDGWDVLYNPTPEEEAELAQIKKEMADTQLFTGDVDERLLKNKIK